MCSAASNPSIRLESAEAAADAEQDVHPVLPGGDRDVVQVQLRIGLLQVRRRRHDLAFQRERARRQLERADGAQRMPDHRLDRAHRDLPGVLAEAALEGGRLVPVVLLGPRAVRVDVPDRGRIDLRPVQGVPDRLGHLPAVGLEPGHVESVAAAGETQQLGVDPRAPPPGRPGLLQHQHRSTLGQDEPVAAGVERAGGVAPGRRCSARSP
jgi:hypothetical protein